MRNIRCNKCNSLLGKLEEGVLIIRTGFGSRMVFHAIIKPSGCLTCWRCKNIVSLDKEVKNVVPRAVQ